MEQSWELVPAAPLEAIVCNLLCAAMLIKKSVFEYFQESNQNILERVKLVLPTTVQL
jgi:hypothetical protein